MNTVSILKNSTMQKFLIAVVSIAAAIALPQVFHLFGLLSGLGSKLGEAFLPMHLPVLFAAFFGGPLVGAVVGVLSPILSFAISGMPAAAMLPFMAVELAAYGLVLGLMKDAKMPVVIKLAVTMIAGRLLKAVALAIALFTGTTFIPIATIWNSILIGLPGIALQLVLVPLATYWIINRKNNDSAR